MTDKNICMFDFKGDRFMPPEILDIVLDQLAQTSNYFLLDYVQFVKALGNRGLQNQIMERMKFLDFTNKELTACDNKPWSSVVANNSSSRDPLTHDKRDILLQVDEYTNLDEIHVFARGDKLNFVYCGEPEGLSVFIQQLLGRISTTGGNPSSVHVIVDVATESIHGGQQLFGLLNPSMLLNLAESDVELIFSFPGLTSLRIDYLMLDRFIYQVFSRQKPDAISILHFFLTNIRINMPMLESLYCVKISNGKEQETCNFLDVSTLMLNKFQKSGIGLTKIFKVHSFSNWDLSRIKFFSGHRFKYDETSMTGSPERMSVSLRENISFLREMAINETIDATPYYRVSLIPHGVTKTRIKNWVSMTKVPLFVLRCSTLESLELQLLNYNFEVTPKVTIQGLYVPHLSYLSLLQQQHQLQQDALTLSNRRQSVVMPTSVPTEYDCEDWHVTQQIVPVTFSSWNDLSRCKSLFVCSTESDTCGDQRYIFNIKNLRSLLPVCDLAQSFQTYLDDKQKFIVV